MMAKYNVMIKINAPKILWIHILEFHRYPFRYLFEDIITKENRVHAIHIITPCSKKKFIFYKYFIFWINLDFKLK